MLTATELSRAGRATRERMLLLGMDATDLAQRSGVAGATVRQLLKGECWPRQVNRELLESALNWPAGEIQRRASALSLLASYTDAQLIEELWRRASSAERARIDVDGTDNYEFDGAGGGEGTEGYDDLADGARPPASVEPAERDLVVAKRKAEPPTLIRSSDGIWRPAKPMNTAPLHELVGRPV
jgi:hypothetical protein